MKQHSLFYNNSPWAIYLVLIFITITTVFTGAIAGNNADFLIIENPDSYSILDEYQQQFSVKEKQAIPQFSPFQVISSGELLGDQITKADKFIYNGKICFIPVNEKLQKIQKKSTWEKLYKKCILFNDTAVISSAIKVKQPETEAVFIVNKGSKIKRIFQYQSMWYVLPIGSNGKYGWYQGGADVFSIKKIQHAKTDTVKSSDIAEKIHNRLLTANEDYKIFFEYFNTKTQQQKSIPHWTMVIDGPIIRCILNGSSQTAQNLEQSTRYITSDIEHILLGKPFYAHYQGGEIVINPRSQF